MERFVRTILVIGGLLMLILVYGFATRMPWVEPLWPVQDEGGLSFKFIAAMQAAIAAAMLWIGITGRLNLVMAGAVNLLVMFGGQAISLALDQTLLGDQSLLVGAICAVVAICSILLILWARRFPNLEGPPMPAGVKWSFWIFIAALIAVAIPLILQMSNIMPWPLSPATSVLFGWMFLGDAFYFLYAQVYPRWPNAAAQLWSFLAYDLILIFPFLDRLLSGNTEWVPNLTVYIGVLIFSGIVAIYFIFIHPTTRLLGRTAPTRRRSPFSLVEA